MKKFQVQVSDEIHAAVGEVARVKGGRFNAIVQEAVLTWGLVQYRQAKRNYDFLKGVEPQQDPANLTEYRDMISKFAKEMELFKLFHDLNEKEQVKIESMIEQIQTKKKGGK